MNLKNYTSQVEATRSIGLIEEMLVDVGATDISKSYNADKTLSEIKFRIDVRSGQPLFFKISAKVEECYKILMDDVKRMQPNTREIKRKQAMRTAWKIVHDWVEIQVAMIKLEQAEVLQLFLPYVLDVESDKTFYERIEESNLKLLK